MILLRVQIARHPPEEVSRNKVNLIEIKFKIFT
jgi:hypothetical protein